MDMQGSRQLAVTQQQAWDALNDPEVLKRCIPGCDKVEATGEGQYAVGLSLKIGPVSARFAGKITLSDLQPPSGYTLHFDGQGGVAGFGKGSAQVSLTPADGGTTLAYTVHAQVGGKVAQLGQRLIDGAARSLAEDFFKRFDEEMQARHGRTAEPSGGTGAVADKAVNTPSKLPAWAWTAAAFVAIAIVWLVS
ncbi:SRPBCC family protein [Hylemonella sp. W303a]|uniref:SRPBCC family protein n=1 Tax=Hylemonella sp. W303a TaxID=3389873 RepID=UPI00396B18B5